MDNTGNTKDAEPCLIAIEKISNQSIPDQAYDVTVQWDVAVLQYGPLELEASSNAVLVNATGGGLYQINVQVDYEGGNDLGVRSAMILWYRAGNYPSHATRNYRITAHPGGGQNVSIVGSVALPLEPGDRILVQTEHNGGSALNIRGSGGGTQVNTFMTMARLIAM